MWKIEIKGQNYCKTHFYNTLAAFQRWIKRHKEHYSGCYSVQGYRQVEEYATSMEQEMVGLYNTSTLSKEPNRPLLNKLCMQTIEKYKQSKQFHKADYVLHLPVRIPY